MPSLEERRKALEKKKEELKKKKADLLHTIKNNLEEMEGYIGKIERNPFELRSKAAEGFQNDFTGDLQHHLNEVKEAFEEAEMEESNVDSEESILEEDEEEAKEKRASNNLFRPAVARAMRRAKWDGSIR
jgi:hypothetical protein